MSVSGILNSLGGVYRDTIRLSGEADRLAHSSNGRHLRPNKSSLMENNGTFHTKLFVFQGTIQINFQRASYNIPLDIFLPPNFPVRPPICFVRPTDSMVIKENHRHVGRDGMVYMPYLNQWRNGSHTLVGAVSEMQLLFGRDPPVYSRPQPPPSTRPVAQPTRPTPTSASTQVGNVASPPGYGDLQAAIDASKKEEEERLRRQTVEKSKLEQATLQSIQQAKEERTAKEEKDKVRQKLHAHIQTFYDVERVKIIDEFKRQKKLDKGAEIVGDQLNELIERKEKLESATKTVDETNKNLETWIETVQYQKTQLKESEDIDSLVEPTDIHSQQMLNLACKNASISDCLYFLDRALVKGTIPLDLHLKQVRKMAKKQFLVRAHLMKIAEFRAKNKLQD